MAVRERKETEYLFKCGKQQPFSEKDINGDAGLYIYMASDLIH